MSTLHIIATLCAIANPQDCRTQEVTNDQIADVGMQVCMLGQGALAEFMRSYPQYRLVRWACVLGERKIAS